MIAGGAVLAVALLTNAYAQNQLTLSNKAYADGQHLVSVFVDGNKRVVATSANTVGGALEQLKITTGKGDVIEPAPTTTIDQPIYNVNIYRALPATIFDDGKKVQVLTGYQSARQIVAAAGLTSYPEDIVTMDRVNDFGLGGTVGRQITIQRAKPIQVVIASQVYNFRTQKSTVGELFVEKGLTVGEGDVFSAKLDSPLSVGQRIVVNHLSQTIAQNKQPVAMTVTYEYDANQPLGYTAVKQSGKDGVKIVSYVVDLKDGVETGRKLLEERVLEPAVARVIVKGSKVETRAPSTTQPTAAQWEKLRICESGNNYANKRNSMYRGAYQFDYSTWANYGGYYDPADAPPAVQDAKAFDTYARRGASPWPLCGRFLR